jgi:hypothetical protein
MISLLRIYYRLREIIQVIDELEAIELKCRRQAA